MNYAVIILAAGCGSRMNLGYNKMLLTLNNQPLVTLASKTFFNDINCKQIIYVVNENEVNDINNILFDNRLMDERCQITVGGSERQYSVYNGLLHVKEKIVLVHDGARPFITNELITTLVTKANLSGCAIPGVKVKDTIKLVNDNIVEKTLDRSNLYAVQTPQACNTKLLKSVHEDALQKQFLGTDEASLIEQFSNSKVLIVNSTYENIKITTKEDLIYANILYDKYFN